jgi:hypothetical protein
MVGKRRRFNHLDAKIAGRQSGMQFGCKSTNSCYSIWIGIDTKYLVVLPQKVDEIATIAASGVENTHARRDAAFQQLVEEVDVNLPELLLQRGHGISIEAIPPAAPAHRAAFATRLITKKRDCNTSLLFEIPVPTAGITACAKPAGGRSSLNPA